MTEEGTGRVVTKVPPMEEPPQPEVSVPQVPNATAGAGYTQTEWDTELPPMEKAKLHQRDTSIYTKGDPNLEESYQHQKFAADDSFKFNIESTKYGESTDWTPTAINKPPQPEVPVSEVYDPTTGYVEIELPVETQKDDTNIDNKDNPKLTESNQYEKSATDVKLLAKSLERTASTSNNNTIRTHKPPQPEISVSEVSDTKAGTGFIKLKWKTKLPVEKLDIYQGGTNIYSETNPNLTGSYEYKEFAAGDILNFYIQSTKSGQSMVSTRKSITTKIYS